MSLEENKAIIRRLFEAENERNLALLDELIATIFRKKAIPKITIKILSFVSRLIF